MFNILDLNLKELVKDADDDLLVFETGNDAKEYIAKLASWSNHKFQPRKAAKGDDNWKLREQEKFDSGDYVKVTALESRNLVKPDHFVHLSRKGNCALAYTKNDEKGRANVQTVISIRGYLETFFSDVVSEEMIEEIKEEQEAIYYANKLKLAYSPDEIESVYTNFASDAEACANSCMRAEPSSYAGIHPTRVYGAGDLAVAYLTNDDGKTTHRVLVWPEKKLYSRVYGTSTIHNLLKKLGYIKSRYHGGANPSMAGAKLLRIEHPNDENRVIMPYVDEKIQVIRHETDDKFFCFSDSEYSEVDVHETGGSSYLHKICKCAKCGIIEREHRLTKVTVDREDNTQMWCSACTKSGTFSDFISQKILSKAIFVPINVTILHPYNKEEMDVLSEEEFLKSSAEYVFCARNRSNAMLKKLAKEVIVDKLGNVELWSKTAVNTEAWISDLSKKIYSKDIGIVNVVIALAGPKKVWGRWAESEMHPNSLKVRDVWGRNIRVAKDVAADFNKMVMEKKKEFTTVFSY